MITTEILAKVRNHASKQRGKSINPSGKCLYRGPLNTKCFIGCLIDDYDYNSLMDNPGFTIQQILENFPQISYISPIDLEKQRALDFLKDIQGCHDNYQIEEWDNRLNEIEAKFGITN